MFLAKRLIPMPASVPDAEAEKVKKAKTAPIDVPAKKRKGSTPLFHMTIDFYPDTFILATEDAAPVKVKKSKTPTLPILNEPVKAKPAKKIPTSEKAAEKTNGDAKVKDKTAKKSNGIKEDPKTKKPDPASYQLRTSTTYEDDEDENEVDDQTAALLKGFESDGDEEDALNEGSLPANTTVPGSTSAYSTRNPRRSSGRLLSLVPMKSLVLSMLAVSLMDFTKTRCVPTSSNLVTFSSSVCLATRALARASIMPGFNSSLPLLLISWQRLWTTTSCLVISSKSS